MNPQDHIDDYMAGKMNAADKAIFEQAMQEDAELRSLVDNYHIVKKVSGQILEAELLSEVEGVAKAHEKSKSSTNNKYLLVAALLLALAAAIFFITRSSGWSEDEKDDILIAYYNHPDDNDRSGSNEFSSTFEEGQNAYSLSLYEKSEGLFEQFIATSSDLNQIQKAEELLGHVYIHLDKYDKAEELLKKSNADNLNCLVLLCQVLRKEQPVKILEDNNCGSD